MTGEQERKSGFTEGCQAFDAGLEAHLEGENQPGVILHARECSLCGCLLADLEKIRQASAAAPLREGFEAEPPDSMWVSLRASLVSEGIIRQPQSFWQRWLGAPASLWKPLPVTGLAAIALAGFIFWGGPKRFLNSGPETHGAQVYEQQSLAAMDQDPQLDQMEQRFKTKVALFDPSLRDAYVKSLASLDSEILECRRGVHRQPSNPLAVQYLASAYAQKAEVLQSALETNAP